MQQNEKHAIKQQPTAVLPVEELVTPAPEQKMDVEKEHESRASVKLS